MSHVYSDEDEVPQAVMQALLADTTTISHHSPLLPHSQQASSVNTPPEYVMFCEPARFRNGFCISFLLSAFESNIALMLLGVYMVSWLNNVLYLLVVLAWIPFLWLLVIGYRWRFFGYRVVTNYRAAIVIPHTKRWFCPSGTASSYYKDTLFALSRGELTRRYGCVSRQTSYLAKLVYGEGRDGHGNAMINGVKHTLHFGYVKDIQKLEEVLLVGTENFIGKAGRNPQFEYRVENFESCFEFSIIIIATLHALLFVLFGFILAVTVVNGGYNIQSMVLLGDLGLVAVACALCSLLFPGHKFGTNQKILIGKMNYFLK